MLVIMLYTTRYVVESTSTMIATCSRIEYMHDVVDVESTRSSTESSTVLSVVHLMESISRSISWSS